MKKADAVIIGFGKGGKTLASALAGAGNTVILVEKSAKMYGGTCINTACIPTKSLIHSAYLSSLLGGSFEERANRYAKAVDKKNDLTGMLRAKNYHKLADHPNITVLTGTASFLDEHRILVDSDGVPEEVYGDKIFINTGARPFIPPIPGLADHPRIYTSESMMNLKTLPRKLIIIGGGYIGMEFASMYANFGSEVTVIQDGGVFLPREDREIAAAVLDSLKSRNIQVILSASVLEASESEGQALIRIRTGQDLQELQADAVLVATGRRPDLTELHPERAGIALTARGAVQTDEHLRTNVPHIWAMGDAAGGLQFTYISLDDSRIVKSQLLGAGERTTSNRGVVPYSVFLEPPFARAGLTEEEARSQGYKVLIAKLPVTSIPKAHVLDHPVGLLKAVIDAENGRILGAHLFCDESHEMINTIKLAMDAHIPYTTLRDNMYTHPTMSEALNELFANLN